VLQGRHPVHAAPGQGLHHQHRLLRGRHGRRHLTDQLHGVQGRRAGHVPGTGRAVRPGGHPSQRTVPGTGEHPAAEGAVRQGPRAGRPPPGPRPRGPLRGTGGDRRRGGLPRQRRLLLRQRRRVPRRRRYRRRLRHPPVRHPGVAGGRGGPGAVAGPRPESAVSR
jgi:hypothetical protein